MAKDIIGAVLGFADLAKDLEKALDSVKTAKSAAESAKNAAADAHNAYQSAVSVVLAAKAAYDAHISEATSGFAQVHQ